MSTLSRTDRGAAEVLEARAQWRRRATLVGGGFQLVFGAAWVARGLAPLTSASVACGAAGVMAVVGLFGALRLRRGAPRPRGTVARVIERRLTAATVAQFVLSIVLPFGIAVVAGSRLVLPSITVSIGALLVWIHHEVDTPFHGAVGGTLIGTSLLAALIVGRTQVIFTGLVSGALLFAGAVAGLTWLGRD
jgi:hypothetical protein